MKGKGSKIWGRGTGDGGQVMPAINS